MSVGQPCYHQVISAPYHPSVSMRACNRPLYHFVIAITEPALCHYIAFFHAFFPCLRLWIWWIGLKAKRYGPVKRIFSSSFFPFFFLAVPPPPPLLSLIQLATAQSSSPAFGLTSALISQLVSQRRERDAPPGIWFDIYLYKVYIYISPPTGLFPPHGIYQSSIRSELQENEQGYLMRLTIFLSYLFANQMYKSDWKCIQILYTHFLYNVHINSSNLNLSSKCCYL